ncbi:MAG: hypothetical protein RMK19_02630 [Bacteroidia bacterium]|nr:hypothetical protein [Bacteroidia bacterium]MDW8014892.1 hypothetical protein [Bacteroidia bacterium]
MDFLALVLLQLSPINTHRPTQGLNAAIVEKNALQVESGFQSMLQRMLPHTPEAVLQLRLGVLSNWEALLSGGLSFLPLKQSPFFLAFKGRIFHHQCCTFSIIGGMYIPFGVQAWIISDWELAPGGSLSLNFVAGTFQEGSQLLVAAFYTQSFGRAWLIWVESFTYIPESPGAIKNRYGGGTGIQYRWGAFQQAAIDLAWNYALEGRHQLLIGLSYKLSTLRKERESKA